MNIFEYLKDKLNSFLKKIGLIKERAENPFVGNDSSTKEEKSALSSTQIYHKQLLVGSSIAILVIISGIAFLSIPSMNGKKSTESLDKKAKESKKIKVEVASAALDPERMWRNHFEDKLEETQVTTKEELSKIASSMEKAKNDTLQQTQDEIQQLKDELALARQEMQDATNEIREMNSNLKGADRSLQAQQETNLESIYIDDDANIEMPKDSKLYIPETAYVEGTLIGGISVSTSVGSSSEPVPVVIRVTGKGSLPDNFGVDLKDCKIQGSSYGDLSSERAIIRAEVLVCENRKTEEIVTTKVSGLVYGDDGMNGIKGKVVDMSTKHIKNAAIGGLLSGFANTMKPDSQFTLSSLGAVNTTQQGIGTRAKDNLLSGAGTAADKIADYYIKQAENMSPVLLIPAGRRVDIVFTKGVYLGSNGIVKVLEKERNNLQDEVR